MKIIKITCFLLVIITLVGGILCTVERISLTGFSGTNICHPEQSSNEISEFSLAEQTTCELSAIAADLTATSAAEIKMMIAFLASINFLILGLIAHPDSKKHRERKN